MYIVKKGRLQVVGDDGKTVIHTLHEGAVNTLIECFDILTI